jgi:hypothetical protein
MKQIISKILDFPQMVNQKVMNAKLNSVVNDFDSQNGIRSYVKTIYQVAALVFLLGMEYVVVQAVLGLFGNAEVSIIGKVGGLLTLLLMAYSAFPMAQVIKSRGESLDGAHNGMVEFVFKDFVVTNIRIFGEVAAIGALFVAFNSTLSFVFGTDLSTDAGDSMVSMMSGLYSYPMAAAASLVAAIPFFDLSMITNALHSFSGYALDSAQNASGWSLENLGMVCNSYINVIIGLAALYVNLAIYNFLYAIVAALVNFVPRLAIPLSIRNTNA